MPLEKSAEMAKISNAYKSLDGILELSIRKKGGTMKNIYPLIITEKLKEAVAFYKNNFGFIAVFEQDWYVQLLHEGSGREVAFMTTNVENQPQELRAGFAGKGIVLSLEVEDANAEWERLKGKDLDVVVALRDEEWGQRHFIIADPAGVYVDVVQQLQA